MSSSTGLLVPLALTSLCSAFVPSRTTPLIPMSARVIHNEILSSHHRPKHRSHKNTKITTLQNGIIIDVDDNFFTASFFSIGILYSLGKAYNRYLLEEVAFEQRRMDIIEKRLEEDPTLTELDLRREESDSWTSIYGKKNRQRRSGGARESEMEEGREGKYGGSRVAVLDKEFDEDDEEFDGGMTDDEIAEFESKYGVDYDPYYDEPYDESELPKGKYKEDKSYGDRRYSNGEVFYKDETSGMFYRQGSRPRQKKFWDLNSS